MQILILFFLHFRLHEGANCLKFLQYPENSIEIIQDKELNLNPKDGEEFVQISPQRIKLKLRPGIDFEFSFEVAQSKDYPVDLYYLMDLSNSMSDDKETIVRMGKFPAHKDVKFISTTQVRTEVEGSCPNIWFI